MTNKNKKAMEKRVKITGSGRVMHRRARQSHFNAKDSGTRTLYKRRRTSVKRTDRKAVKTLLSH